jgi:hypothetical protein
LGFSAPKRMERRPPSHPPSSPSTFITRVFIVNRLYLQRRPAFPSRLFHRPTCFLLFYYCSIPIDGPSLGTSSVQRQASPSSTDATQLRYSEPDLRTEAGHLHPGMSNPSGQGPAGQSGPGGSYGGHPPSSGGTSAAPAGSAPAPSAPSAQNLNQIVSAIFPPYPLLGSLSMPSSSVLLVSKPPPPACMWT